MLEALYASETGLLAHQTRIDTISNNLANVNTPGFKKGRVSFEDLMLRQIGVVRQQLDVDDAGRQIGLGTIVARTDRVFSQGDLRETERPLDFAIEGAGFIEVETSDGGLGYTRLGSLNLDENGYLVTGNGLSLSSPIRIPVDATGVLVASNGEVRVEVPDEDEPVFMGQLEFANFVNPNGLRPAGGGILRATEASGPAYYSVPGENGMGTVRQGYLEAANVDLVEELVELTMAQRAYELNARVVQAADEILSTVNGLRR